ncbi:MAG: hypothetical protein K8S87_08030 [Planctomycetes bacterium]|nr:hypothetical protein [Planctomycetota bacterium]
MKKKQTNQLENTLLDLEIYELKQLSSLKQIKEVNMNNIADKNEVKNYYPNETFEILHTDYEGYQVILHKETNEKGIETGEKKVTYTRYPKEKVTYRYLEQDEIARHIRTGQEFEKSYISSVSIETFKSERDQLQFNIKKNRKILEHENDNKNKAPHSFLKSVIKNYEKDLDDNMKKESKRILDKDLIFKGCIIGNFNLSRSKIKGICFENDSYIIPEDIVESHDKKPTRILHFPEIYNHVFTEFFLSHTIIDGDLELKDGLFNCDVSMYYSKPMESHKNNHNRTQVNGSVSFENCEIYGCIKLDNLIIKENFNFNEVNFIGSAYFNNIRVFGDTNMQYSVLLELQMDSSKFNGICNLKNTAIYILYLGNSTFRESLLISAHSKLENILKKYKTFTKNILLKQLYSKRDKSVWEKNEKTIENFENNLRSIHSVDLSGVSVLGDFDCESDLLINKRNPVLMQHRQAIGIEPLYILNEDDKELKKYKLRKLQQSKKQYAWVEVQYRRNGDYISQDAAHLLSSECDRLATKVFKKRNVIPLITAIGLYLFTLLSSYNVINCFNFVKEMFFPILLSIFFMFCWSFPKFKKFTINKLVLGYGVNPWNIIITVVLVLLISGGLFTFASYNGNFPNTSIPFGEQNHIQTGLYFSVITFATVGFGDVSATGWAAGLAMVEGLLGVILNAALIVVLFRKLVR